MTDGKRKKKSKSEPFGKKLRTRKDTKSIVTKPKQSLIILPPPSEDDLTNSSSSSNNSNNSNGKNSNDSGDPKSIIDKQGKQHGRNIQSKENASLEEDANPAYILIPILGEFSDDVDVPEISMEDAFDYPISGQSSAATRRKNKLRLNATSRKKSPLTLKLEKARKEVEDFNKDKFDVNHHPVKDQILLMDTDVPIKAGIIRKIEDFEKTKSSYDQSKFNNWVRDVLQLPFGKRVPVPISMEDGKTKIKEYLDNVRKSLDTAIAGQDHVKDEVVDFIARLISNPISRGNILALVGPPGTGKTRLVRKGIAEALGRPFHVINLGGMNDIHVLTGHDLTYTGAKYGRIAQILIQSQCENPVVYLDELDKIQSSHDKGMEIFRALTHILDEEQNHEFYDEYFANVKINLSKILFVASLNDPENIEPVLLDRLKLIRMKEINLETKVNIVRNYILPEICKEVAMTIDNLEISDDVIKHVISDKSEKEEGCRKLKRNWEIIIQKLNTQRITGTGAFEMNSKIRLDNKLVEELLQHSEVGNKRYDHFYT